MSMQSILRLAAAALFLAAIPATRADEPASTLSSEYRTVDTAITAKTNSAAAPRAVQPGYLGVTVEPDTRGHLVVAAVADESPAARAGIAVGDSIVEIGDQPAQSPERLREFLMSRSPGDELKLTISRADCTVPLATKL